MGKKQPETAKCQCGSEMVRAVSGPSATVKEKLDNGYMPRALERFSEAERLFRERASEAKVPKK